MGLLMKAYRESYASGLGRRGLTQEELLRRMADVDASYAQRFSHTTVSRWESGATRPTVERLRVFGRALDLSDEEVSGLIMLAGLSDDAQPAAADEGASVASTPEQETGAAALAPVRRAESGEAIRLLLEVVRFFALRFVPLAALITGFHYLLSLAGWDNAWMPVICVAFAYLVVMGQGVVFPDESAGLRDFYWISVFFVLTTPLLQFAPLGLDHYNFHLVAGFGGTMMPYMLALLVNLTLAWTAGLMFHLLWRWRYRDGTTVGGTVTGAASAEP